MLRERDGHGGQVLTDSILRSYRDGLRSECSAEAGRMWHLGSRGLDLGLRRIDAAGFLDRIRAAAARSPRLGAAAGTGRPSEQRVSTFLLAEMETLDAAIASLPCMIAAVSAAGRLPPGCETLLRTIDYAWVHFPDAEGGLRAGADRTVSFLARARVAAMYYRGRLGRLAGRG
jgi:hypothetical protein